MVNAPEITSHDSVGWAADKGTKLNHIEPSEPNQTAYIERFNQTYWHEVLGTYAFKSIGQVERMAENWLPIYNEQRPHDTLVAPLPRPNSSNRLPT